MSEWRPEGWVKIKKRLCAEYHGERYARCKTCPTEPAVCDKPAEKLVDAIVAALREAGHHFGVGEAIDEPNFAPSGGRWMNQVGTMVFIPDKE